jgi:hypothetical protein
MLHHRAMVYSRQYLKNGYKVLFDEQQFIIMYPDYENVYGSRNQYDHYTVERQHMQALHQPETKQRKSFMIAGNSSDSSKPKFCTEQLHRVEQVKIFHNALQHISDDKLISALTYGTIVETTLISRSV